MIVSPPPSDAVPLNQLPHPLPPPSRSKSSDASWCAYPTNTTAAVAASAGTKKLSDRLSVLGEILFSDEDGEIKVRVVDIWNGDGGVGDKTCTCTQKVYTRAEEVERELLSLQEGESGLPRIRIISIHSTKTLLPLNITEKLMRKILTRYDVDANFLSVLFSFGEVPHLAESGSSNIASMMASDGTQKTSYQIRYAEENHRWPDMPWSVRQTGVYHHHSAKDDFDLFILLHPVENSLFEQQVTGFAMEPSPQAELASLVENPYRMHIIPFALYLDNWRWYFRYLGEKFLEQNDQVMTVDIKTSAAVSLNFDKVQGLRDLKDKALSLSAYCKAGSEVVEALHNIAGAAFQGVWSLKPYDTRLRGHGENLRVLTERIGNTIELDAYALDLKNQYTATDINEHVSKLAEKTTKDTTAVMWITLLTLLYLPGSFVATLYGMNLFVFNQETGRLVIAHDFWIFIATWLLLTLVTFLGYGALLIRNRPRGRSGWHWLNKLGLKGLEGP